MFKSRRLSQKIGRQGQKNVTSRTLSSYFTKLLIILYGLVKMTSGCYAPESVPEKKMMENKTVYPPTTIQSLYKALAYVQLRTISEWLTFTEDEYRSMENGIRDAITKLQQTETPSPPTTTTAIPDIHDQLLDGILHSFNKRSDEREETKQQEQEQQEQPGMTYDTE
jgi:hypothetical protein